MSDAVALALTFVLLLGNAFFVGAEFALVSARRTAIEPWAAGGSRAARITLRAMGNVSLMMAGAQLGITVCSLGLGAVGEPTVAHLLEGPFESAGVPAGLLHPAAFGIALIIVVFLHMVLGEMVPKNIALVGPARTAVVLGPVLYGIVHVLRPLIWLLNQAANLVLRLLRVQPKDEVASTYTREEVAGLVTESRQEGLLGEAEHQLLVGALEFVDLRAADIAIDLSDVVSVARAATAAQLVELCAETGYSRFPVADQDALVGYVHVKDLLSVTGSDRDRQVDDSLVRALSTVRPQDSLRDVLLVMQREGAHLALVVPTDSDTATGVAALEDVIEKLVGEVRDASQVGTPNPVAPW